MGKLFLTILKRMAALIILKVSAVLAAGTVAGIELWQSATMAAFVGVMEVAEALSRAYVADGVIDGREVDQAFTEASK